MPRTDPPVAPPFSQGQRGETGWADWIHAQVEALWAEKAAVADLAGDTGRRGIGGLLTAGAVAEAPDQCAIQRVGDVVTLQLNVALTSWVAGTVLFTMPSGFSPPSATYLPNGYDGAAKCFYGGATIQLFFDGSTSQRYLWTWITRDPWPTALPGVAV